MGSYLSSFDPSQSERIREEKQMVKTLQRNLVLENIRIRTLKKSYESDYFELRKKLDSLEKEREGQERELQIRKSRHKSLNLLSDLSTNYSIKSQKLNYENMELKSDLFYWKTRYLLPRIIGLVQNSIDYKTKQAFNMWKYTNLLRYKLSDFRKKRSEVKKSKEIYLEMCREVLECSKLKMFYKDNKNGLAEIIPLKEIHRILYDLFDRQYEEHCSSIHKGEEPLSFPEFVLEKLDPAFLVSFLKSLKKYYKNGDQIVILACKLLHLFDPEPIFCPIDKLFIKFRKTLINSYENDENLSKLMERSHRLLYSDVLSKLSFLRTANFSDRNSAFEYFISRLFHNLDLASNISSDQNLLLLLFLFNKSNELKNSIGLSQSKDWNNYFFNNNDLNYENRLPKKPSPIEFTYFLYFVVETLKELFLYDIFYLNSYLKRAITTEKVLWEYSCIIQDYDPCFRQIQFSFDEHCMYKLSNPNSMHIKYLTKTLIKLGIKGKAIDDSFVQKLIKFCTRF